MTSAAGAGTVLHLIGLVSPGGVHSSMEHLYALLRMARDLGVRNVDIHAITDGRDEPPRSAAGFMRKLMAQIKSIGMGQVATISGRYFAMDRDKRWERTERAYRTIVEGQGPTADDPVKFIEGCYAKDVTDEFLPPTRLVVPGQDSARTMKDGDTVMFFNFRPDRARQLTHAIIDQDWPHFSRRHQPRLAHFVTFTEYEKGLPVEVAFKDEPLHGVLAEVFSHSGWPQYHTAETEKYAHVTYFLNGGREAPFPGEDRLLVPSPKVATYDLQPEMSAPGVTDVVVQRITERAHPFIVVNYANPDMVGHTGNFDATVKAVEVVDSMLARIVEAMQSRPGILAITADHGNAELKVDRETGKPLTAHTTSPVPFIVRGADGLKGLRDSGKLGDIAPTLLRLLSLEPSPEMDGDDLALR
jgi:2,3-bisphosphoglycerate-independent phosphoglycerate mutase